MEKNIIDTIQDFFEGKENEISILDFLRIHEKQMPYKTLKKCIHDNYVVVDGKVIDENYKLKGGEKVKFMTNTYKNEASIPDADNFFKLILKNFSKDNSLKSISVEHYNLILSAIILFIQKFDYETIINSENNQEYRELIRNIHSTSRFSDIEDYKSLRDRKFIEQLIIDKKKIEDELKILVQNVGQDNINPQKILSKISQINKNLIYQSLIEPLCSSEYSHVGAIKNIIVPFNELYNLSSIQEKYIYFEENRNKFEAYLKTLNKYANHYYIKIFYYPLANILFQKFKNDCSIKEEKTGQLLVKNVKRKYNFNANSGNPISMHFELVNEGEGLSKDIVIQIVDNENFTSINPIQLGILQPNENRSFNLDVRIQPNLSNQAKILLNLIWSNINGGSNSIEQELLIEAQSNSIDWD